MPQIKLYRLNKHIKLSELSKDIALTFYVASVTCRTELIIVLEKNSFMFSSYFLFPSTFVALGTLQRLVVLKGDTIYR